MSLFFLFFENERGGKKGSAAQQAKWGPENELAWSCTSRVNGFA